MSNSNSARDTKRVPQSNARIIQAAKKVFLAKGYSASLDEVAREAGVGRRTLYNQFESKDALLRAMIEALSEDMIAPLFENISRDTSREEFLFVCGRRYTEMMLSEESLQIYRFFVSDLYRHPDLVELSYSAGFERAVAELAHVLQDHIDAGRLRPVDAMLAADRFLSSIVGSARHRAILGIDHDDAAVRARALKAAVDNFLHGLLLPGPSAGG
ncbi:MAG: TetR/AcrR family transcriptional regulator [Steroidobacteraceae bacterium]